MLLYLIFEKKLFINTEKSAFSKKYENKEFFKNLKK